MIDKNHYLEGKKWNGANMSLFLQSSSSGRTQNWLTICWHFFYRKQTSIKLQEKKDFRFDCKSYFLDLNHKSDSFGKRVIRLTNTNSKCLVGFESQRWIPKCLIWIKNTYPKLSNWNHKYKSKTTRLKSFGVEPFQLRKFANISQRNC